MTLRNAFENLALDSTVSSTLLVTQSIDSKTPALQNGNVPVTISNFPSSQNVTNIGTFPVQSSQLGNWTVSILGNIGLPLGAATSALQTAGNTPLVSIDTKTPALVTGRVPVDGSGVTQPVSFSWAGLTDTQLRASAVPVTGTFFQSTQPVSITSLPLPAGASQDRTTSTSPNSARLTDGTSFYDARSIRALTSSDIVSINGTLPVTGAFYQATQPVTATSLPLPTGAATDSTLSLINAKLASLGQSISAGSAPVVIASDQSPIPVVVQGSTVGLTDTQLRASPVVISATSLPLPTGASTSALQTTGNISLSSLDSKTPALISGRIPVDGSGVIQPVSFSWAGLTDTQLRATPVPVTGSFYQATQPVSLSSTTITGSVAVTGTFYQAIQPISASSLPLPTNASQEHITAISPSSVRLTDGTAFYDPRLIRALTASDVVSINGTVPVSGSFYQSTQPVSATALPLPTGASTSALQTTGNATLTSLDSKSPALISGRLPIDGSGVTQPVSAVTLPLPSGASTAALQTAIAASTSSIDSKAPILVSGRIPVDGSGVTQPVSIASSVAVTGPFYQATQPVSAASLPLPTGAATSVKQPALGTAGSASADVLSVQGVSGGTNLSISSTDLGSQSDTTASTDSGTFSLISLQKRLLTKWPAQGPAAPSAAVPVNLSNNLSVSAGQYASGSGIINTDLLTGTVSGWFDASNFHSASFQVTTGSGISAGAITFEQTNDTTQSSAGNPLPVYDATATGGGVALFSVLAVSASATRMLSAPIFSRYVRVRISTAVAGGTIQCTANFSQLPYSALTSTVAQLSPSNMLVTNTQSGTAANNVTQLNGIQITVSTAGGGATNSIGTALCGPLNSADYSSVSWAAASGSAAVSVDSLGSVGSFDINLTAFTAGSSLGLDIFLQWSPDNGTTFYDLWQCEAMTAVGHIWIPPMHLIGRRRMRWVNRGGAATTATVTVTASKINVPYMPLRQWFDRTAGLLSGTLSATSATYDVVGCNTLNALITIGGATTPATYQLQISADGTNFASVGTATAAVANATTSFSVTNACARFARVICTSAGSAQTGTVVAITGNG